ncbi:Putative restriction endonuclease [Thermoflexibacter ruber]|uniref:Putative restriction endonuclease n=1 Tax=Thermoflexibacter ruber TaxID=1003 RepID=A0A1I2J0A1_9BACT|nr:Putative restriction endonuclease [Thermoflexibacter ruber]
MGVPDLLVEIISPSSIKTDRFTKYQLYENKGVAEYWIIDLKNESIEVFENTDKGFKPFSFASKEGKVNSKLLEGLEIEIKEIFQ